MKLFILLLILLVNYLVVAQTENKDKNIFQRYDDFLTLNEQEIG